MSDCVKMWDCLGQDLFGTNLLNLSQCLCWGIRKVCESDLHILTPFYHSIVHSFAYINNLFFKANSSESLPQLIWFGPAFPFLNHEWSNAGLILLNDLPLSSGSQIDVMKIWNMLPSAHGRAKCYLHCCVLQKIRALFSLDSGSQTLLLPSPLLLLQAKGILQKHSSDYLSLTNWEKALDMMPFENVYVSPGLFKIQILSTFLWN